MRHWRLHLHLAANHAKVTPKALTDLRRQLIDCAVVLGHLREIRVRGGLNTPVAVIRWQQDVSQTRLGSVRLLPGHADEDGRAVWFCALRRDRVSLLDGRHHLAGSLVDVVLGVVLILVLNPALVDAIRIPAANPLVALLGHVVAEGLQALFDSRALLFWVFVFDFDVDFFDWILHRVLPRLYGPDSAANQA